MRMPRRSRLPLNSSGATTSSIDAASSATSAGKSSESPYWLMTESTSTPGSPARPRISFTSPSAFLLPAGHFVTRTTTFMPAFAPCTAPLGMKMSCPIFLSSGVTKPKRRLSSNVPTISSLARSTMRMISPSRERPAISDGEMRTTTRSPFIAPPRLTPGTKMSLSVSFSRTSGMMKPKPFADMESLPTTRFMRSGTPKRSWRVLMTAAVFSSSSRAGQKSARPSSVRFMAAARSSAVSGLYAAVRM